MCCCGMPGNALDRTTISYTINEEEKPKAFNVMFALGVLSVTLH